MFFDEEKKKVVACDSFGYKQAKSSREMETILFPEVDNGKGVLVTITCCCFLDVSELIKLDKPLLEQ